MELAREQSVPPFIICSDKTLKDMCAKLPRNSADMETVYGMGAQKIQSYGAAFAEIIYGFCRQHTDDEMLVSGLQSDVSAPDGAESVTTIKKSSPVRKRDFYVEPDRLDEVELTDICKVSDLANSINALNQGSGLKKITAAFINDILLQNGYIEEFTLDDGTKTKRVTQKGLEAGIREEERRAKYGRKFYALTHTRESQRVMIDLLKEHFRNLDMSGYK